VAMCTVGRVVTVPERVLVVAEMLLPRSISKREVVMTQCRTHEVPNHLAVDCAQVCTDWERRTHG
jgi:hypothetical protein